jgi:hypothetical protein
LAASTQLRHRRLVGHLRDGHAEGVTDRLGELVETLGKSLGLVVVGEPRAGADARLDGCLQLILDLRLHLLAVAVGLLRARHVDQVAVAADRALHNPLVLAGRDAVVAAREQDAAVVQVPGDAEVAAVAVDLAVLEEHVAGAAAVLDLVGPVVRDLVVASQYASHSSSSTVVERVGQ